MPSNRINPLGFLHVFHNYTKNTWILTLSILLVRSIIQLLQSSDPSGRSHIRGRAAKKRRCPSCVPGIKLPAQSAPRRFSCFIDPFTFHFNFCFHHRASQGPPTYRLCS
ncbi:hypothetical protein CLOSTASPAR_04966 [[Clostridium] asparagiforme DSM 15981]|uniref:Uncharacterized protein n=1 Tax=[Clostridium] asparagiforme DSM 15981 TaxID=518636 RepID=C0D6R9_9FIRM|nr:hypothetical protein CLOSTASPAR_04966 [[Clostridium] asparagiforme DSM 15981]